MAGATLEQAISELPVSQAASETRFFERATLFEGRGTIDLGEALRQHPVGAGFLPAQVTGTIRNFRFKDVILDSDTLLLLKNGSVIPETNYFVPPDRYAAVRVREDALVHFDDDAHCIIGHNLVHWVYQHWLTQCLPAIDHSMREHRNEQTLLVMPLLQPWQEEMLAWLGYAAIPRLLPRPGAQYLLRRAEYSQFLNGGGAFSICPSALETCRRMLGAIGSRPSPHAVVYVPCDNPYYGPLSNQAELIELLQSRGVYVLSRGELTTAERFNLFRHAEVVIGAHSDGLADIAFCQPGALLWELMPGHYQNFSYNRLAQTAELDYWGDLFGPSEASSTREWRVDLDIVNDRLRAISRRLAAAAHVVQAGDTERNSGAAMRRTKPLDELVLEFESLGDNCEFGLVQRMAGVDPEGLLRFAGIYVKCEERLERMAAALEAEFEGLGAPGTVTVRLEGETGRQEYLVYETAYQLLYHTFMGEAHIEANELLRRETERLTFLRQKLLDDLRAAEKIWIWRSQCPATLEQVLPLLEVLRRFGPNKLLWVVEADDAHASGTIEQLEDDLIKGYVGPFAEDVTRIGSYPWFQVCQKTYDIFYPVAVEEVPATPQTARSALTGIAYLLENPAPLAEAPSDRTQPSAGLLARSARWFGRRKA